MHAWYDGKYYEAGKLGGLMMDIIFDMPEEYLPHTAGVDFIAGHFWGIYETDIQEDLKECLGPDLELRNFTSMVIPTLQGGQWEAIMHSTRKLYSVFYDAYHKNIRKCSEKVRGAFNVAHAYYEHFFG